MYDEPSKQRGQSRSSSRNSTSSRRSQRQPSQPPVTAPPEEQDVITPIPRPEIAQSQLKKLQGVEQLQELPPDKLENKNGIFQIQHDVKVGPPPFGLAYSTEIEMTPKWRTRSFESLGIRGCNIDFIQAVRSSTDNNWKTTAKDHGYHGPTDESGRPIDEQGNPVFIHRAELTEQETGTGWRVDQSMKNTPFHEESLHKDKADARAGRHHLLKRNESVKLKDKPAIAGEGYRFDAMSTAMSKTTGREFGTVEWGFSVDRDEQGEPILKNRPPTFLEDNLKLDGEEGEEARERNRGRLASYRKWNEVALGQEQNNQETAEKQKKGREQQENLLRNLLKTEKQPEQRKLIEEQLKGLLESETIKPPKQVTRIPGID